MCGVAGLLDATRAGSASLGPVAVAMAASLTHRGPDAEGCYVDEPAGYAVGHRRLSIIDLSPQGAQPMTSASGRWVLAYNGELYNHRDLRAELASTGVRFRGHSDTETLVEAIDAWGIDTALARTNAMFAFAAWDSAERVLYLARDRMGEKPLYWYADDRRLIFASELRALRAVPGFRPGLDAEAATAVLRWSFVPHPRTILAGVRQLAPGGLLTARLDGDRVTVGERRWWSLTDTIADAVAIRGSATAESAADELVPLLADAVAARLESDVPLGSFLSGGIDSSLVAALAQQALGATALRTFTVKMPELGFDESPHAEAVARHLGTDHTTVELTAAEVMAQIPTLARVWDEPFADPSMLPSLLLCRTARQQLTVCLAGDGGDEVFAGYNRHSLGQSLWRRASRLPVGARRGLGRLVLAPSPARIDALARRVGGVLPARMRLPNPGDKAQKAGAVLQADTHDLWAALAQVWPADALRWSEPLRPASLPGLDPIEEMLLTDTAVVLPDQMPGEGGPGVDGRLAGGAGAVPGPPGARVGVAPAAVGAHVGWGGQGGAAPGARRHGAARHRRSPEDGLRPAARHLVAGAAAPVGSGAGGPPPLRGRGLALRRRAAAGVGGAPSRHPQLGLPPVGRADAGVLARRVDLTAPALAVAVPLLSTIPRSQNVTAH